MRFFKDTFLTMTQRLLIMAAIIALVASIFKYMRWRDWRNEIGPARLRSRLDPDDSIAKYPELLPGMVWAREPVHVSHRNDPDWWDPLGRKLIDQLGIFSLPNQVVQVRRTLEVRDGYPEAHYVERILNKAAEKSKPHIFTGNVCTLEETGLRQVPTNIHMPERRLPHRCDAERCEI